MSRTIEVPGSPRIEPFKIEVEDDELTDEERTEELKKDLENTAEVAESHIEETLTKLDAKTNSFDDFKDVGSPHVMFVINIHKPEPKTRINDNPHL